MCLHGEKVAVRGEIMIRFASARISLVEYMDERGDLAVGVVGNRYNTFPADNYLVFFIETVRGW